MANLGNFDASTIEPAGDREALQPGEYRCVIVGSQWKDTKSGSGQYLEFEFDLLDAPNAGRKLWHRLNLKNANKQAVEIAKQELAAICKAVAKLQVSDSTELHGIALNVKVGQKEYNGQVYNECKAFKKIEGSQPVQQQVEQDDDLPF